MRVALTHSVVVSVHHSAALTPASLALLLTARSRGPRFQGVPVSLLGLVTSAAPSRQLSPRAVRSPSQPCPASRLFVGWEIRKSHLSGAVENNQIFCISQIKVRLEKETCRKELGTFWEHCKKATEDLSNTVWNCSNRIAGAGTPPGRHFKAAKSRPDPHPWTNGN